MIQFVDEQVLQLLSVFELGQIAARARDGDRLAALTLTFELDQPRCAQPTPAPIDPICLTRYSTS